jgi:hypothetical protein
MQNRNWVLAGCALAALWGTSLNAQQQGTVIKVPFERGIYYQAPAALVPLASNIFMPLQTSFWTEMFGVGQTRLRTVLPGASASIGVVEARPLFYVRGYRPGNRVYLLRLTQREDHRELRMTRNKDIADWARFRQEDLMEVEIELLADDLARLRSTADLRPGEYVFVSVLEPRFRTIRLAFDFTVLSTSASR